MCESLAAHASRRSRRSLLSMRLLCFNELDLILRRSPTGRANARPMTGSVAVSKDGPQYRFVIPGTSYVRGAASTAPEQRAHFTAGDAAAACQQQSDSPLGLGTR